MVIDFKLVTNSIQATYLLDEINCKPLFVEGINQSFPLKKRESPIMYCDRIAKEMLGDNQGNTLSVFKGVFIGRRLIGIPSDDEIHSILKLYSGSNHIIHTSVVLKRLDGTVSSRRTSTRVKVKHLSNVEAEAYISSKQWEGNNGGYDFTGLFQRFVMQITGSHSGAIGMPCYEIANLLQR